MSATAHFTNIRTTLAKELAQANNSIRVAVAWFTDQSLYKILLEKVSAQVSVVVVVRNDVVNLNPTGIDWQGLIDAGGTLYFSNDTPHLHHKFCVVDDKQVITGSYNWTYGAQRNHENIVVSSEPDLLRAFSGAFDDLLDHAKEVANITKAAIESPPAANAALAQEAEMEVVFKRENEVQDSVTSNYELLVTNGNGAYFQKQYDKAETCFRQALTLKPDGIVAHMLLAGLFWRTEQFEKSIAVTKEAEAVGLKGVPLWNVYGLAYDGLKKYKEAIEYFNRAIQLDPTNSMLYRNKFVAQQASGQHTQADVTALEGGGVANDAIKKYKRGEPGEELLHAYIDRAILHSDGAEARKHAQSALDIFNHLPVESRDMHDLDDINANLK